MSIYDLRSRRNMAKPRSKPKKAGILRKVGLAILPGFIVAGLVFSANKIKNLFSKRVQLTGELKSIADLTMLNMSNFDVEVGEQAG